MKKLRDIDREATRVFKVCKPQEQAEHFMELFNLCE